MAVKLTAKESLKKSETFFCSFKKAWNSFASEVPEKFRNTFLGGFKHSVAGNSLSMEVDTDAATEYIQDVAAKASDKADEINRHIEALDVEWQELYNEGLSPEELSKFVKHLNDMIAYIPEMSVNFQAINRRLKFEVPESTLEIQKKWGRLSGKKTRSLASSQKSTTSISKADTSSKAKSFSQKDVSYNENHLYPLAGIYIPVPDRMRYVAKTPSESIPNGTAFRDGDNRYGFICYSGKKLNDASDYKNSRFGVSVNGPFSLKIEVKSGTGLDSDLLSQAVKELLANLARQTNNVELSDVCIDKAEDAFVVAHGTVSRSSDNDEYWEGFLFAVIDGKEKMMYQGIIYINAPQNRDLFDSVIHNFLIRISPLSEREHQKNLSWQLGEYAKNGKMDALKAAELYLKDVFWTPDNVIVSAGKHNKIQRVDGNLREYVKYPIFAENLSAFCAEIRKAIEYAEENPKLIIEKSKFHKDLLQVSRGGNITGIICFEFFAWHMLAICPNKDSNQYTVFVDQNLWVGIPDIHGYVAELIKTLRSYNGTTGPFDVKLNPTVNLDTPTPLNCKPVPGSEPLKMMEVSWHEDSVDIVLGGATEATKNPVELITTFNNSEEIEVAGTQYEGRSGRIERVKVGDRLKLVREPDNEYDENAIDIRNEIGSLGHIPIEIAEDLASLLDLGIPCAAIVTEVIPRSARGAKARKAILKVRLECKNLSEVGMTANAKEKKHKGANGTEEKAHKEEKQRKAEETLKKADAEKKAEQEATRRQYEQAHKQWKKDCEAIKAKRSAYINTMIVEEKASREAAAKAKRDTAVSKANAELKEQMDRIATAESVYSSLGIFKFSEKKAQKSIIEDAERKAADAKAAIARAESEYKSSMASIESELPALRQLSPSGQGVIVTQMENEEYKKAILNFLSDGNRYTITELMNYVPELSDFNNQKVASLVRQLRLSGDVNVEEIKGKAYFSLASAALIVRKNEDSIQSIAEKKFPLPTEPEMPAFMQSSKTSDRKNTAAQMRDENYKSLILEFLCGGGEYTVTELINHVPELSDFSNQKVASLVRQLRLSGRVNVEEVNGKSYISLA